MWNPASWRPTAIADKALIAAAAVLFGVGGLLMTSNGASSAVLGQAGSAPLAITSAIPGKCLDDSQRRTGAGNKVDLFTCNGSAAQFWVLDSDTVQLAGECMSTAGVKVVLESCNGRAAQKWAFRTGEVVNLATGKCLDDPHFSTTNGIQLELWRCHGSANQAWHKKALNWIISTDAVGRLNAAGAGSTLITTAFHNPYAYVVGSAPSGYGVPTADYKSYAALASAFRRHVLPGKYKAILYDNEDWYLTPKAERQDPTRYEQLVANLVHKHHMSYIAAPAQDIVRASGHLVNGSVPDTYLARDIAGHAAAHADVIDIQAQFMEGNLGEFSRFVGTAVRQARNANPHVKMLVGLSTGPDGKQVTGRQIYAAYAAVWPLVDGYWLNIPGHSSACPHCGKPRPDVALYLLHKIYGDR
jgi:hypothetical protein